MKLASPQILDPFLVDALRLSAHAVECVKQLTEQAEKNRVSPAHVRILFQTIHTLKGSAVMVKGAEMIVDSLHELEGKLACKSVVDSARDFEWLTLAQSSVAQTQASLLELKEAAKRRSRKNTAIKAVPKDAQGERGILARTFLKGKLSLLWFPLSATTQVIGASELLDQKTVCIDESWVPVIGSRPQGEVKPQMGLALQTAAGKAVVSVEEILGVVSWTQAAEQGATAGLDLFLSETA